jgi:uncharacterized protein YfiM (DUF2279 family)
LKSKLIVGLVVLLAVNTVSAENWLGKDKVAHFGSSLFLTCYIYGLNHDIAEVQADSSRMTGAGISLSLGLSKEWLDSRKINNRWSWADLVWDAAGICCGLVLINNKIIR